MALNKEQIADIKRQYIKSFRIELQSISDDPNASKLLRGTVEVVDERGRIHVSMDNGTMLALVPGDDEFRLLTPEEEYAEWLKIKFYSPLLVQYSEIYDSEYLSDQSQSNFEEMSDTASLKYIDDIKNSLEESINDYLNQEEFFIGNTGSEAFDGNLTTLSLSVEEHSNKLWGIMELQLKKSLSPVQTNTLKEFIEDEYKNGWGKHLESMDFALKNDGHTRLNVHFWQESADYRIMTESEFEAYRSAIAEESPPNEKSPVLRVAVISGDDACLSELPESEYVLIQELYNMECDTPNAKYTLELDHYHHHGEKYGNMDMTGASLFEANHLATKIAEFDEYQKLSFDAYVKTQEAPTVRELINAAHNINDIIWHPFGNDRELGEFALDNEMIEEYEDLPDSVYKALDLEKAGAKFREIDGGVFVNDGYLTVNEFDEIYDGITLPDSKPLSPFQVQLCCDNESDSIPFDLPTTADEIRKKAIKKYNVSDIGDLYMIAFNTTIPYLKKCEVSSNCFGELNILAETVQNMDQAEIRKFKAVLEAEQPHFIKDALDLTGELNTYKLHSRLTNPDDYGKMAVCEKFGFEYDDAIIKTLDCTKFGVELMARNGIVLTQYGGLVVPQKMEEAQASEAVAEQDAADEDESEEQEFEGMQIT